MSITRYSWPLIALAALVAFVTWQGVLPYLDPHSGLGDHLRYLALAAQPFGSPDPLAHEPPFCWRILTPLIVHFLPFSPLVSFWLVTVLGLAGATLALMWFLRGLGLSPEATVAGGFAFVCLLPATGFTLYDDLLVDPLAFALLALALGCVVYRRGPLLLASLVLMAFDKETAIFGGVFALAWSWQRQDRSMFRWSLGSLAGVLIALVGLHDLLPPDQPYGWIDVILYWTLTSIQMGTMPERLFLAIVGAWGILLPLAAYSLTFWRTHAHWLLLLLATAQVFISYNIERVVVYAFPVMIAAACFSVEDLAKRWHVARWWLWGPVFALELSWTYSSATAEIQAKAATPRQSWFIDPSTNGSRGGSDEIVEQT